jgi:succinoglycan biosynthesis transport protein ExoP
MASYQRHELTYADETVVRTAVFRDFLHAIRRHRILVLLFALIGTSIGGAVALSLQPQFTAGATVVLEMRKQRVADLPSVLSEPTAAPEAIQLRSETKILQSDELARRVITGLGLAGLPEFQNETSRLDDYTRRLRSAVADKMREAATAIPVLSFLDTVAERLVAPVTNVTGQLHDKASTAIDIYRRRFAAINDGRSLVITVQFTSADPALAAKIVNTHIELYLADQVAFQRTATQQAGQWIREQIAGLQTRQRASEEAVQGFRESNKIVMSGGTTLLAQQLGYLNMQVPVVRAELAQREIQLRQARDLQKSGRIDTGADILNSLTIQSLRQQEALLVRHVAELQTGFGNLHPSVIRAKSELADLRNTIRLEMTRIVANLENSVEVAREKQEDLAGRLAGLEQQTVTADRAEAKLHELERDAEADRTLLKTLISRSKEIEAQDGAQRADARVLSEAFEPVAPTSPRLMFLLPLIFAVSTLLGAAVAFLRELTHRGFKGAGEIEQECEIPSVGSVPLAQVGWRKTTAPHDFIVEKPRSSFAEAVRSVRQSVEEHRNEAAIGNWSSDGKVVLITSSLPKEGKTVLAIALARSFALSGKRTLLIDCDMRKPSMCGDLGASPVDDHPDLAAVLEGSAIYNEAIRHDSRTGLDFIPSQLSSYAPQDLLSRSRMAELIAQCRRHYDVVVLDSPPVTAVSDPMILSRYADQVLFAVRWGYTPREIVKLSSRRLLAAGATISGIVMTNVDMRRGVFSPAQVEYYHQFNRAYYHE